MPSPAGRRATHSQATPVSAEIGQPGSLWLLGATGGFGVVGTVSLFDGGGRPPGQVLGQCEVRLGVATWLVAGEGDGAEDPGPARQGHGHRRPEVEGGEQLQVVGVASDAAEDV